MPRVRIPKAEAKNIKRVTRQRVKRTEERNRPLGSLDLEAGPELLPPQPVERVAPATMAVRALVRKALEARTDLPGFYEFVIRHETTKQPLKVAAHQRLMFAFVVAHPHCVIRQPVGTGKTFGMAALGLWLMGQDPTQRGALVSKTQGQAGKVLRMMADYIVEPSLNAPLTMVFPWMKKGTRVGEQWTQSAITIDRPPGIRDPSAVSVGVDGAINGARLSWLIGDDILDSDNTMTAQGREQTHSRFDSRILSRVDPQGSRAVVTNTPWHREDLTFMLEAAGWPTLIMDIYGNIQFSNVDANWVAGLGLVRPSQKREGWYRLLEHDPDQNELTPLWPERYSAQTIADIRRMRLPHEFARLFLCQPFDEGASRCRREWVELCKANGRGQWHGGAMPFDRGNPVYTGVDIAVGSKSTHDESALVTFELLPDKRKRLLDVECGHWSGPEILTRIIDKHDTFGSALVVETNSAQDFVRQFALEKRKDLRVRSHNTNQATKHSLDFGVESIFTELKNGAWVFPCTAAGKCPPEFDKLFEDCLYYQPPPAHTGDRLMAMWIGKEGSRRGGGGRDPLPKSGLKLEMASGGSF